MRACVCLLHPPSGEQALIWVWMDFLQNLDIDLASTVAVTERSVAFWWRKPECKQAPHHMTLDRTSDSGIHLGSWHTGILGIM